MLPPSGQSNTAHHLKVISTSSKAVYIKLTLTLRLDINVVVKKDI